MAQQSSGQWNLPQFLETLNFFGEVPFLGSIRWLQQMFDSSVEVSAQAVPAPIQQATFGIVGTDTPRRQALAEVLRSRRLNLRFLTIEDAHIQSEVELSPVALAGVAGIFVCDRPNSINWPQWSQQLARLDKTPEISHRLFDFSQPADDIKRIWGALDDVVMGGVSSGGFYQGQGAATFAGTVSTANSGGFSSVRTRDFEPPFDLQGWQGIRLHVKGDGQRYKFILRDRQGWDSLSYCQSFDTTAGQETVIHIPFATLRPTFRAKTVEDAAPFNPASIYSLQVMLSKFEYDKALNPHFEPGPFQLNIQSIDVYAQLPQLNIFCLEAQADDLASVRSELAEATAIALHPVDATQRPLTSAVSDCLQQLENSFEAREG